MNRQLLLPSPEGSSFERLRQCLYAAFPVSDVGHPGFQRSAVPADARAVLGPRIAAARAASQPDRRSDTRAKMSVYRSARLRWNGREGLCLIRNLSSTGMMCRSLARPAKGERIEVEMRSGDCIAGTVMWAKDGQFGVRFDQVVNVAALLNPRTQRHGQVQRMPRLSAGCSATLTAESGRQDTMLLDISQGGAKIEAAHLREGDDLTLAVTGLDARRGTVRWTQDGHAGIAFFSPIPLEALARWAVERPLEPSA